jgi:hypothetical protein
MAPTANTVAALAAMALAGVSGPACAGAPRAWVSGHGVDQAGCGAPASPCRSLQYAHDHAVNAGGEIDILDPAGYGAISITKAISIVNDGVGTAGVQTTSGIAININAGSADTVYLRGLNIDGVGFAGLTGVQFNTGASLSLFNCVVRHFSAYGVALAPTADATAMNIVDTVSSDNHGGGILVRPISNAANVVITGVTAQGNGGSLESDGVTVDGSKMFGKLGVYISNTNASNNVGGGLLVENTDHTYATVVGIDRSQLNANGGKGIDGESNSYIHLSNSVVMGNSDYDVYRGVNTSYFVTYGNNIYLESGGAALDQATPH